MKRLLFFFVDVSLLTWNINLHIVYPITALCLARKVSGESGNTRFYLFVTLLLLKQKIAEISSEQKFQSSKAKEICTCLGVVF